MKYGWIGLGNMATAIIKGMIKNLEFSEDEILGYDVDQNKAISMEDDLGVFHCSSPLEVADKSDVVILAVKPQILDEVLPCLKGKLSASKLLITIAAGKKLSFYEEYLGNDISLVRVIPNINAKVLAATSGYVTNQNVTDKQKQIAVNLFNAIGTVTEIPEHLFPVFSTLAGAVPAFTYLYIDALARAAVKAGMPKKTALSVAASSVYGSANLIMESAEHPWELVDQVCSPGGTTIEGVTALQRAGFEFAVIDAVDAVIEKDIKIRG